MTPGSQPAGGVAALVEVVDRLRSPGGCPWDAAQTHESLARFAVEESYELSEAIASGDRDDIIDELGDVLFQVVFHARLGAEHERPFDLDEVAGRIVAKLRRRHPHVFAGAQASGTGEIEANWDAIKAAEKPGRASPLDGIPAGLPPLERAAKIAVRYQRAGRRAELDAAVRAAAAATAGSSGAGEPPGVNPAGDAGEAPGAARGVPPGAGAAAARGTGEADPAGIGDRLLALVIEATGAGIDPATALAATLVSVQDSLRRPAP